MPQFAGVESEHWQVRDLGPVDRDDVLPAFEASAQAYGCGTEQIGGDTTLNIYGELRSYYGVSASCESGTLALITLTGGRISMGCAKPQTLAACDALLRRISEAR